MAKIDDVIAGAEGAAEGVEEEVPKKTSKSDPDTDLKPDKQEEIHIPHLPLTGVQKIVCLIELVMAGMLTVFVFFSIFKHIIDLPGRVGSTLW